MRYAFSLERFYEDLINSSKFSRVHIWAELCNQVCKGCEHTEQEGLASLGTPTGNQQMIKDILLNSNSLMVSSSYGKESCSSISGGPFTQGLFKAFDIAMLGEWQADAHNPTQSFLSITEEMTQYYLKRLPNTACQSQQPMGEVSK